MSIKRALDDIVGVDENEPRFKATKKEEESASASAKAAADAYAPPSESEGDGEAEAAGDDKDGDYGGGGDESDGDGEEGVGGGGGRRRGRGAPNAANLSARKQPAKDTAARPRARKSAAASKGYCSLSKKELGDRIKAATRIEKYGMPKAGYGCKMDIDFFRAFFDSDKGCKIRPREYNEDTAVVTAHMNHSSAGNVFGVSKVKGGNRMETVYVSTAIAVLYPKEKMCWVYCTS